MTIEHVNPEAMHRNPATTLPHRPGRPFATCSPCWRKQARQKDVAKLTMYLVAGQDAREGFAASQEVWGMNPTAITVLQVAGLAHPAYLVEIDALAHVSEVAAP